MTIKDRVRELRRVRAGDLKAHPRNWRTHPKAQRDVLRGVLEEIGYADALLCREHDDGTLELIDGHLRAETTPDELVPVLVLDVSATEAEQLLVTLDPLAAMATTDANRLGAILEDLVFTSDDVTAMLAELGRAHGLLLGDGEIDAPVPAMPDAAITQPGDLWTLGEHRLLCGDSGSETDLDRLLDGAVIHLVNTDPPYNVKVEPRSNNAIAAGLSSFTAAQRKDTSACDQQSADLHRSPEKSQATHKKLRAKDRPLINDFVSDDEFDRLLAAWFGNIARVLVPGGGFYIWGGYANCGNYPPVLKACKLYFSQAVIWIKEHPVLTRKDFMGNHEWCFYGWKEGAAHRFFGPSNVPDTWSIKKVNPQSMVHLTEKPAELAARAIQYSSQRGENVLDLFGGSGSTLIACQQHERRSFLMEIDPLYCDVIVQRWEQFTGQKAIRTPASSSV
ncbi:MAG: DNA modification methylase [Phycisphaeraceae bacterium]|nr:DNA modification methylase [Phycisphaeraceae bacterium]